MYWNFLILLGLIGVMKLSCIYGISLVGISLLLIYGLIRMLK